MIGSITLADTPGQRLKVLLIADDLSLRSLVSTFLISVKSCCTSVSHTDIELGLAFAQEAFDAVIMDADQPSDATEAALANIKGSHPSLWTRIIAISSGATSSCAKELIERHCLYEVPRERLLHQLRDALQHVTMDPHAPEVTLPTMQTAELKFDSSRGPSSAGLRGSRASCRQLIYQHRNSTVDLLVEPREDSGRIAITGQILHSPKSSNQDGGLPVLLVSGVRTMMRTNTNLLGEFCLECSPLPEACLQMRLREGAWVSLHLGGLDWGIADSAGLGAQEQP